MTVTDKSMNGIYQSLYFCNRTLSCKEIEYFKSNTYGTEVTNMDNMKIIQGKFPMQNAEYEQIEVSSHSGIKLCFEFPKSTENDEKILKEVRSILSGELRDTLQKNAG